MATISTYDMTLTAGTVSVTVTSILRTPNAPNAYTVYEIATGTVVASGLVSGSSVTIPAPGGSWPPGSFLVLFTGATWNGARGYVADALQISVLRSGVANLPSPPANGTSPNASDPTGANFDCYMHGVCGMGPQRWAIYDAANPTNAGGGNGGSLAAVEANIALDQGAAEFSNPTYADSARPRPEFVTFPNNQHTESGYAAGVESVVTALGPGTSSNVVYFEGLNEPQGANGLTQAQSATQFNSFRTVLKAANSSALAMGPCEVSYPPNSSSVGAPHLSDLATWLADITTGSLDAFSVHDYNAYNGDFLATDTWLGGIRAALTTAGYSSSLPFFLSETGNIMFQWGTFDPQRPLQWMALLLLTAERWGIPKEHIYWFYDYSNPGFAYVGDNSWIKEGTGDLRPHAVFYRVYSEEVYGKTYNAALDFGTIGDNFYRANVFAGTAGKCVAIVAQGNQSDTVTLNVSDAGPITYSNWAGITATATVTGGQVVSPIGALPTYVRLSAACTVSVADVGNGLLAGSEIATTETASSGSGAANPQLINDGVYQTGGYLASPDLPFKSVTLPDSVTLTWATAQPIKKVVIRQLAPWTNWYATAMTAGKLEYWNGSGWLPVPTVAKNHWDAHGSYSNATATSTLGQVGGLPYMISFYDQHWCHNIDLAQTIVTTKLRWTVTQSGYGQIPDVNSASFGGFLGDQPQELLCSELLVIQGVAPPANSYVPLHP